MFLLDSNEKILSYYLQKFGKGFFVGPHYLIKKSKNKIKIKGNTEAVYDLSFFFISNSNNNKIIKKATIFVPKDLDYETNFEIIKEKVETRYKKIEVSGEGYFKADFFLFIGKAENEYGKINTKKPKGMKEETEKNYFSFLSCEIDEGLFKRLNFFDFKKEAEFKSEINIKNLEIINKKEVIKEVEITKYFVVDGVEKEKIKKEFKVKHTI